MVVLLILSGLSLFIWLFLIIFWGNFWLCDQKLDPGDLDTDLAEWPSVTAIIPARDEAESIGQTVHSLLSQDYQGTFSVVLVDDQSSDGTADIAKAAAVNLNDEQKDLLRQLDSSMTGKSYRKHSPKASGFFDGVKKFFQDLNS